MPAATEKNAEASGETPATPVTLTARAAEKVKEIRVEDGGQARWRSMFERGRNDGCRRARIRRIGV